MSDDAQAPEELKSGQWELVRQWRRAVRIGKWVFGGFLVLSFIVLLDETIRFYSFFSSIHRFLGYTYGVAVIAALVFLVGLPAYRYIRIPKIIRPPDIDLTAANHDRQLLTKRCRYVERYCLAMSHNPELKVRQAEWEHISRVCASLRQRMDKAPDDQLDALISELKTIESDRINPLLSELDKKVDSYIRKEGVTVGIGTAVSMNGTLDAFIVLWRNVNMISRISRLYYGRPGFRGSMLVVRDVATAVVIGRAMDDITDMAGDLIGRTIGRMGGIVAGPLMDGAINALMTMKVGYLAKRRCRCFEAWTEQTAQSAVRDTFKRVASESTGIIAELGGRVGGLGLVAANAARDAAVASANAVTGQAKNAWGIVKDLFDPRPAPVDEAS